MYSQVCYKLCHVVSYYTVVQYKGVLRGSTSIPIEWILSRVLQRSGDLVSLQVLFQANFEGSAARVSALTLGHARVQDQGE